ncbi:MAG: OmpH family outer membrane protein [Bacillota bacterium]
MNRIKNLRPIIVVAIALVALVSIAFIGGAIDDNVTGPVGYVDGMRLAAEFKPIVDLQKQIDDETMKMQDRFDQESKDLNNTEKEKLFAEFQEDLNKHLGELNVDQRFQEAQVLLFSTISKVAESKGLSTVIDSNVVYYGNPALDITDAVLAEGAK